MNRRNLLGAILAAGFAPAAIGSGVLMPIRRPLVYGTPGWTGYDVTRLHDTSANVWYVADGSGFQGGEVNQKFRL